MATLADIKRYFEAEPHGRKVPMEELKQLTPKDRDELTKALDEIGWPTPKAA